MPRESFQAELDALQADVVAMGEHVLAQLDDALRALETGDGDLATEVIEGDAAVNERYLDLEARCVDLFALQQPVATDLRIVAAAFKILTDLERVGDLATNLGQYALADGDADRPVFAANAAVDVDAAGRSADGITHQSADDAADRSADDGAEDRSTDDRAADATQAEAVPPSVIAIGRDAHAMLADAIAAFEAADADACEEIAERDDDLDVLCQHAGEDVVRGLLETGLASATAAGDNAEAATDGATDAAADAATGAGTDASGDATPPATSWDVEAALDDVSRVLLAIRDLERVGDHAVNVAARTYYMVEHDPTLIV